MTQSSSSYDFQETFSIEEASALIAGLSPRHHPKGVPRITKRMQDDVGKGLLTVVDGVISRDEIARWLVVFKLDSDYRFSSSYGIDDQFIEGTAKKQGIDAPELELANWAYQTVKSGYGDQSKTFKNRVIDLLKEKRPTMKSQQVERIAIVANPDKSTGRKKYK